MKLRLFFLLVFTFVISLYAHVYAQDTTMTNSNKNFGPKKSSDTISLHIRKWLFDEEIMAQHLLKPDTLLRNYHHKHNSVLTQNRFGHWLGNIGLPATSPIFELQKHNAFPFFAPYQYYAFTPENTPFFNTNIPFTIASYTMGSAKLKENYLDVVFTRNILPAWNFALLYRLDSSNGKYANQKTSNNSIALTTNYTGGVYEAYLSFTFNKMNVRENGGVLDSTDASAEYLPVLLNDSKSSNRQISFLLAHQLNIGHTDSIFNAIDSTYSSKHKHFGALGHIFRFSQTHRAFTPARSDFGSLPPRAVDSLFVDSVNTQIVDSVYRRVIENVVKLQIPEGAHFRVGGQAYIGNRVVKYYNSIIDSTFSQFGAEDSYSTSYLGVALFNRTKGWKWSARGKYFFEGYNAEDLEISFRVNKYFPYAGDSVKFSATASYTLNKPSISEVRYFSNFGYWNIDADKKTTLDASFSLVIPKWQLGISANIAMMKNYIFMATEFQPFQYNDYIQVLVAGVDKNFTLRNWHFDTKLRTQYSSNSRVLHLPKFLAIGSIYYQGYFFAKALHLQIGIEGTYTSEYFAPVYSPVTGMFYHQTETLTGNYPIATAFVNMQIRRVRLHFMFEHLNTIFSDEIFSPIMNYPVADFSFRFGASFRFHD